MVTDCMFVVCNVQTDKGFDKSAFAKQMAVMRGQVIVNTNIHYITTGLRDYSTLCVFTYKACQLVVLVLFISV